MNQEYFTIALSTEVDVGLSLADMGTVAQFEVKNICTVPGVANFWYGVVNFKGSLLWILDSDRFFNLNIKNNRQPQKLTAVILKNQQSDNQKKVAIVTQQLKGILAVEPSCLKPLTDRDNVSPMLRECCCALVKTELQTTYVIDSAALLNRLHQESILVSA
ncbi:MAG TPA: chemotaxis protein CheW [Coleofasciculaceae cyanobacterium]|jgi:twitching motility protein PilI